MKSQIKKTIIFYFLTLVGISFVQAQAQSEDDPSIDIRKQAEGYDVRTFAPGDTVDFEIEVTNTGAVDLNNVVVSDPQLPACDNTIGFLASGQSVTYSCSTVLDSGTSQSVVEDIINVALVSGVADGVTVTDADPSEVLVEKYKIEVIISIKGKNDSNCLNINGHGVIPVAILGAEDVDVSMINTDPYAENPLRFQGLTVRVRGKKGPLCSIKYANNDSYLDMVCHFEDDTSEWIPGATTGTLTGSLFDGTLIEGSDSICIVP